MIVANPVKNLSPLFKNHWMCWITYFKEFMLLFNEDTVINEAPA